MWQCSPTSRRCGEAAIRSIAPGASPSPKPNFESAWPVEIAAWVSPETSGVTRIRTSWTTPRLARHLLEALDVVQRVEHDVADARLERELELGDRLGVAVQVDAAGVKAAGQRQRQLTTGGDVTGQALLRQHPVDGRAGERLGGEQHVTVGVARRQPADVGAGTGAQVVLGDDERRRAELVRELDRVAAADLEVAAVVDAAADRIDV